MRTSQEIYGRGNKLIVAILLLFKDYSKADSTTWDPAMYVTDSDDGSGLEFLYGPNIEANTLT